MKQKFFVFLFSLVLMTATGSRGQDQNALYQAKIIEIVKDIQGQHSQIASNQAKIDSKLADLSETIRVARVFAARVGGAHAAPAPPKP